MAGSIPRLALVILGLMGPAQTWADQTCPFNGQIDFKQKRLAINLESSHWGAVAVEITQPGKDNYQMSIALDHVHTPAFDISTQLKSLVAVVPSEKMVFKGQVQSRYSLVNYKPIPELSGNFVVKDNTLFLNSLSAGGVVADGALEFVRPYKLNLSLRFIDVSMQNILKLWGAEDSGSARGTVSGQVQISGGAEAPALRINLTAYDVAVQDSQYDSIVINAEGVYPVVYLKNSSVAQSDGLTFNLEGSFDLANHEHVGEEIAALTKSLLINSDKSSSEWTIRRKSNESRSGATEFKYFMRKGNKDALSTKEDPELFGVKRSINF